MSQSKIYREQHGHILQLAQDISRLLHVEQLAQDAKPVRSLLAKLAGAVTLHLSMEDEGLYPRLLEHSDDKVRATAQKFSKEMGGIKQAFIEYKDRWSSAFAIQLNAPGFVRETNGLLEALGKRIRRENEELYPLLDRDSDTT